jgi:hypothetical protein
MRALSADALAAPDSAGRGFDSLALRGSLGLADADRSRSTVVSGPRADPLDLHEGICAPPPEEGCARWPKKLRLASNTGLLVPGRCKATNLCRYCARLFAIETSEMLLLDAMEDAPSLYVVLTAREHLTRPDTYGHLRNLRKSLRKRWPNVRWAVEIEFQRRGALHLNLLVKGVPKEDADSFRTHALTFWCSRVDAEMHCQYVGVVADEVGVVRYISQHFMKESQAPPLGWKGHRYSAMRDYLVRPAAVMRREARASLQLKREIWKAENAGHAGGEALVIAEHAQLRAAQLRWECVALTVDETTGEIVRARPLSGGGVTVAMRSDRPAAARALAASERARVDAALAEVRASDLSQVLAAARR